MSMPMTEVPMAETVTFHNGKAPPKDEGTEHPVYGSNGTIGRSAKYNHEAAIILGRVGAYCGSVEVCTEKFWASDNTIVVKPKDGFDLTFLYYRFKSIRLNALAGGAAQPLLTQGVLKPFHIQVPDHPTQIEIASILSAYDDLIDNNRRRIALLEEAARQLYKEWFVRFRFPGHEHVPEIDGLPEGWSYEPLGNLTTKIGSGATPRGGAGSYKNSGITLIRSLNVYDYSFHDDGLVFIDDDQARKLSNVVVEPMDVLLNITGASVARCCLVPPRHLPARVNQHVMIIRVDPTMCGPNFLLHSINSYQRKEKLLSIARSGGATREALTKDTMAGFEILMPPNSLVQAFEETVSPLFLQSEKLSEANSKLATARDLLLPKLMSGEIVV